MHENCLELTRIEEKEKLFSLPSVLLEKCRGLTLEELKKLASFKTHQIQNCLLLPVNELKELLTVQGAEEYRLAQRLSLQPTILDETQLILLEAEAKAEESRNHTENAPENTLENAPENTPETALDRITFLPAFSFSPAFPLMWRFINSYPQTKMAYLLLFLQPTIVNFRHANFSRWTYVNFNRFDELGRDKHTNSEASFDEPFFRF